MWLERFLFDLLMKHDRQVYLKKHHPLHCQIFHSILGISSKKHFERDLRSNQLHLFLTSSNRSNFAQEVWILILCVMSFLDLTHSYLSRTQLNPLIDSIK